MWQRSITEPNSIDQAISKQLCQYPNQVYLDEHPIAAPPVFDNPNQVRQQDPGLQDRQTEIVEIEDQKLFQDYTARDWLVYL